MLQNDKLIRKQLLTITVVDSKQFTLKDKLVTYIGIFVEFYNQKNYSQVYEIYEMIDFEEIYTLTIKNSRNLDIYQIIKILSVLYSSHIVFKNKDKFVF